MPKENTAPKSNKWRLLVFVFLLIAAGSVGFYKLMSYQIVQGAEYASQAVNTADVTTTEVAARGEIVDRYNRPIAVNRMVLNVDITYASLDNSEQNQVIKSLIELFEENEQEWLDEFPIVLENGEYKFVQDEDGQIDKIKAELGLQSYATAKDCMDHMISDNYYDIQGYSDEDTLNIASVRMLMALAGFSKNNSYTFAEDINQDFAGQLVEIGLDGVIVQNDYVREYPDGTLAPHIIGYTGKIPEGQYEVADEEKDEDEEDYKDKGYNMDDTVGLAGVEAALEDQLKGVNGVKVTSTDIDGTITEKWTTETKAGNTVQLTLDSVLQTSLQNLMQEKMQGWKGSSSYFDGGSIAVLDVKTGGVLSAVSYPSYDLNDFLEKYSELANDEKSTPLLNRAFSGIYRPGSAFKTVTAVAGLSEGVITASSSIYCGKTMYFSWDHAKEKTPYNCLAAHGSINVYTALERSCNIFFYTVGDRLNDLTLDTDDDTAGNKILAEYANALGMGTDIGLEISNRKGRMSSQVLSNDLGVEWNRGDAAQSGIGQSETMVTPAQMATAAATIANHGTRYNTHVVKSIQSYNGNEVQSEVVEVLNQLENTNNAFDTVIEGMTRAGNYYSLQNIAAKTGTPQTAGTSKNNSTIIAFYPADNPEIAFGVVVENTPLSVGGQAKQMVDGIIAAYEESKQQIPEEYK